MFSLRSIKWFLSAIPRTPKKAGLLMGLYYRWFENFTPAGHAAAALLFFSMFAGLVPGFWAAWIFCGLDFLFLLALVPSLFLTGKKNSLTLGIPTIMPVMEFGKTTISVQVMAGNKIDAVALGCFRMDPSIRCCESSLLSLAKGETATLQCEIAVGRRGAYKLPKVAVIVPEVQGMLRALPAFVAAELLVLPKPVPVLKFPFLTSGTSGMVFAPLLMPSLSRGLDFVGVREYREGDALRDLHHKAFARYGKPFTKEFETERGAGCVLVLDVSAENIRQKSVQELLISLAAGIGLWLMDRGALGRLFIGDEEIPIAESRDSNRFLEALSRIPQGEIYKKGQTVKKIWSPAARPMGPVLRLGLFPTDDSLVHKQIVVAESANDFHGLNGDSVLLVSAGILENCKIQGKEVSL